MGQFLWLEAFEIGIAEIDGDHRDLLALMRDIHAAFEAGDRRRGDALLTELVAAAADHFRHEEEFLGRIGYPGLDIHAEYHAELLDRAEAMRRSWSSRSGHAVTKTSLDGLFSFLVDDIINGDLRFKSYLEHRGLIKRSLPDSIH